MATTPRDALRYPALGDSPDVVRDITQLATDVEGQLHRAYACLSTARPTGVGAGFIIRETDTGAVLIWDGTTWAPIATPAAGGGGTPGVTAHAQFSASSAQSVPTGIDTPCAFAATNTASTAVTRAATGAGHQFTLNTSGIWAISSTIRYASTSADGERYAGIHLAGSGGDPLAGEGHNQDLQGTVTLNVAVTRYFASGAAIVVNLWQGTGGTRTLEPHASGGWVRLNLALIG